MLDKIKWLNLLLIVVVLVNSDNGKTFGQAATTIEQFFRTPNSLGSVAVGVAEGTRKPNGEKTNAYYGHVDPGNQNPNNLGTFSYQREADSPEEADKKQLNVLRQQTRQINQEAQRKGLNLTTPELINGADLANQAPAAAIGEGAFIERLTQCKASGKTGDEAILCARVNAYRRPRTGEFDAPGLGGEEAIKADQARRIKAINSTLNPLKH